MLPLEVDEIKCVEIKHKPSQGDEVISFIVNTAGMVIPFKKTNYIYCTLYKNIICNNEIMYILLQGW